MSGYDDAPAPDPDPGAGVPPPFGSAAQGPPPPAGGPSRPGPYPPQTTYPPQAPYGQPPYRQPPYGRPAYGQPPYRQPPYGQPPYGQPPYGQPPYGQPPYGQPSAYGAPPAGVVPPSSDQPRRRGNGPVIVSTIVVWALVMVGIVAGVDALAGSGEPGAQDDDPSALVRVADPDDLPGPLSSTIRIPSPGFEEGSVRIETVDPPTVRSDEYAFLETYGDGEPVGWSPCRPIHVVVNPEGAPAGFLDTLLDALGTISGATGLVFVYDGPTTEMPDLSRESYLPERYGDRWAPVLVAWTDDADLTDFKDDVVGLALSETRTDHTTDAVVRVSGEVYLDADLRTYPDDPTGQEAWVSVLHHELGHLIGLDHVDESDQLMYPEDSGRLRSYQEGDRAGLYELGQGVCAPGL